jgi:hypothetical protein
VFPCFGTWSGEPPAAVVQDFASCAAQCLPDTLVPATAPQQIHLAIAGKKSNLVAVTWVTKDMQTTPRVRYGKTDDATILVATGTVTHYDYENTGDQSLVTQQHVYHSGLIHHTVLDKLEPSVEYWYECGDEHTSGGNRLTFVSPPRIDGEQNLPYSVGITGDLGQTNDSHTNVVHWMEDRDLRSVICVGDESYADDLQGRWDSWARLVQPVAARLPWMVAAGNHEGERDSRPGATANFSSTMRSFSAYQHRFRMPSLESGAGPQSVNSYYSYDVPGAHWTVLNCFADGNPKFWNTTEQYTWALQELRSVNRSRTPFHFVVTHCPWYNR